LTDAGRRILEEGQEVLRRARRLEHVAGTLAGGWEAGLRFVVDGAYPMAPVMRALKELGDRQIPTRVQVDVEYQDGVVSRFETDNADIMLALGLEDGGRLQGVELPPLEMVLVVAAGHPLASIRGVDPSILLEHVDLVVKDSAPAFANAPRPAFLGSRHVVRLSDFHSKRLAIASGVGFGWLPLHVAEADLASGAFVLIDLPDGNRWSYYPQLITRRDAPPGRAGQLLIELLRAPSAEHQKI